MPKGMRDPKEMVPFEIGGGGAGGSGGMSDRSVSGLMGRRTGSRAARDTKEPTEYTPEMSGQLRYRRPRDDEYFETKTPRMSDDYKRGGVAKGYAEGGKLLTPQDVTEPAGEEITSKPKPMPKPKPAQQKRGLKPLTPQDVPEPVRYAKGGKIDGCAQRGKTRGRVV